MTETLSRSSPKTGTVLPKGRPFWIVDGRAYDFTEWMGSHPGGSTWFTQTVGRDISALLHTYHPEPARLQKILAKYEIEEPDEEDVPPGLTDRPAPPTERTSCPSSGCPRSCWLRISTRGGICRNWTYGDEESLLAEIRRKVHARDLEEATEDGTTAPSTR